jgi:ribosome-binding protein aMBF1 (putative translation factor)
MPTLEAKKQLKDTFNHTDFTQRIRDALEFIGMEQEELAKSIYVKPDRIKNLLKNKVKYKTEEVISISKRLGF